MLPSVSDLLEYVVVINACLFTTSSNVNNVTLSLSAGHLVIDLMNGTSSHGEHREIFTCVLKVLRVDKRGVCVCLCV